MRRAPRNDGQPGSAPEEHANAPRSEHVRAGSFQKGCGACGSANVVQALHCGTCGTKFTTADRSGILARFSRNTSRPPVSRDLLDVPIPEGVNPEADVLLERLAELFTEIDHK